MLLEAKSNLARLMATENLVIEERNVPTAYFDLKSRVLIVPILNGNLSSYLYDLLLGHEVSHALETPASGWHDSIFDHKVNKDILNVCEDARIEKKIKRKFPGLKHSFIRGYQELMDMDFFGVKGKDLNKLNFIDRVNLYTKGGSAQGIYFSKEENELLREVENTETFDEVVEVAKKIQKFMKEQPKNASQEEIQIKIKVDTKKQSSDDGESEEPAIELDIDVDGLTGDASDDDDEKDESDSKGQEASSKASDEDITSKTDKSFREKEKLLYDKEKKDVIYGEIPSLLLDNIIVPYKDILSDMYDYNNKSEWFAFYNPAKLKENFNAYKNESNKVVSYLVKEFELRKNAEQQSRAKVSKTGELNMSKIHEYKFTDDIFERMTKVPNGKSHGLVMFIDWSGSMHDHINATIKQLLNLVMFCKKVNIPYEVYAFTSQWNKVGPKQNPKIGDIEVGPFSLLNLLSSKMSNKEFVGMSEFLLDFGTGLRSFSQNCVVSDKMSLGGTPLNQSIVAAFQIVPEFKKNNRLQIVNTVFLTDGDSGSMYSRYSYINGKTDKFTTASELRPHNSRRVILRDPVTKASVESVNSRTYTGDVSQQTKALLKLLKERTNCNLLGFFIGETRHIRVSIENYNSDKPLQPSFIEQEMTKFRKDGVLVVENFGYDEYYLIKSSKMETEDEEFVVTSNSTRGLVSAFSKYTEGKIGSRVILNRFIKMIA